MQGNGIYLFLAVSRQVRPFGQVLTDQPVDIFITAALPRAVRVAEVIATSVLWVISPRRAVSRPWSKIMLLRNVNGVLLNAALKPYIAEVAVASFIFTSIK